MSECTRKGTNILMTRSACIGIMGSMLVNGNALRIPLSDQSVQMACTSPPYYGQRDYGVDGQIGHEDSPEQYIGQIVSAMREVKRVLKNNGTLWLNLDDSFWGANWRGSEAIGSKQSTNKGARASQHSLNHQKWRNIKHPYLKPKDLCMIPARIAIALQQDGWWLRCDNIWDKPDSWIESVKDRPTRSHEYVYLLSKSRRYYYDYEAVLEPYTKPLDRWGGDELIANGESTWDNKTGQSSYRNRNMRPNPNGRNRRSVWRINTVAYSGDHPAMFPPELVSIAILAGSKAGDIVLDPFVGSGTTGEVCRTHGRRFVGIDLSIKYLRDNALPRVFHTNTQESMMNLPLFSKLDNQSAS